MLRQRRLAMLLVLLGAGSDANDISSYSSQLCSACEHVWLQPGSSGPPSVGGACFELITQTCSDCLLDNGICTHNYFSTHPQPVSGHFSFCSGHTATVVQDMSTIAWMRLMYEYRSLLRLSHNRVSHDEHPTPDDPYRNWRKETCRDIYSVRLGDSRSAWSSSNEAERQRLDASWTIPYYKAGTSNWFATRVPDAPSASG